MSLLKNKEAPDPRLNFEYHWEEATEKAAKKIGTLHCLSKCTWGASLEARRAAYTATVRPLITFAAPA
jgi:hypothetical protein